ncbi:DHA2 family efflux MFS transporter permease subunit [Nakamurella sp. YIM 132087]|uniref:DHA2 family efflux MFS transporter permease subunit n=1 Tax=Nakamurella alba TaxID=2665158 RepID=A0A7K1FRK4_9ACTN|nr:MFS transporter [Nakamurella alba]MTD16778.1 DHA2 family efflux MFS transporter permease subunit [Nakamurella alba]
MSDRTDPGRTEKDASQDAVAHHLDPRRWWALVIIGGTQLMVILDATIVNVALPHASAALEIAPADRQWLVTAYALPFGALLLLGGRIADYIGRKRMLIIALSGFAIASAIGGAAQSPGMLFAARALQGVFGAIMAPAALALVTVTFIEAKERAKAFAVFGAIAGGGAAIGLVLGGVLTEYVDWRWCLFVNIPVAVIAAGFAIPVLRESRAPSNGHYDVLGAILATGGLAAIVWGFTRAIDHSWGSIDVLGWLLGGLVLIVLFVVRERATDNPLLPLRIFANRNRTGAYVVGLLVGTGLFGFFLFITYFLQYVKQYTPLEAGLAFLPFSAGVIVGAGVGSQLVLKVGPRVIVPAGLVLGVIGLAWLGTIDLDSSYAGHILPAQLIISVGMGFIFMSTTNVALVGISPDDAGVASAMVNTAQQIGGSLGTALLSTIAATATATYAAANPPQIPPGISPAQLSAAQETLVSLQSSTDASAFQAAIEANPAVGVLAQALNAANVDGYGVAFLWSAGLFALAGVASLLLIHAGRQDVPQGEHTAMI